MLANSARLCSDKRPKVWLIEEALRWFVKISVVQFINGYRHAWVADGLLNRTTFKPQPDFYIAWIYRQLFSRTYSAGTIIEAVPVNMSQTAEVTGMRVFMFAARGSAERIYVSTPQQLLVVTKTHSVARTIHVQRRCAGAGADYSFDKEPLPSDATKPSAHSDGAV